MMTAIDRITGSLYTMAAGDALGVPTSFLTFQEVRQQYGWVDRFLPPEKGHRFHDGLKAGEYTDDTEQALALLHSFLRCGRVVPKDVVKEILGWARRVEGKYASPLGPSTERALKAIEAGGDIRQSGRWGCTNGSAMRVAPLGLIHGLREDSTVGDLCLDVALTCLPTHNTQVCSSATAAVAWGVAQCMRGEKDTGKIAQEAVRAAEEGARYGYPYPAPSMSRRIAWACEYIGRFHDPMEALEQLYAALGGGDMAADSVPVAIALFVLGQGDPKRVCECAANLGGDCDTNGAMAGAMAGAWAGIDAVPKEWINVISSVNPANLAEEAKALLELAPNWQTATAEDMKREGIG